MKCSMMYGSVGRMSARCVHDCGGPTGQVLGFEDANRGLWKGRLGETVVARR